MATILTRKYCGEALESEMAVVDPGDAEDFVALTHYPKPENSQVTFEKRMAKLHARNHGKYANCSFQYRITSYMDDSVSPSIKRLIFAIHKVIFELDA